MLTRSILDEVAGLVPAATLVELDIVRYESEAQRAGIRMTPTVVVISSDGLEVFRAEGVPSVNQVLVALAKAI